MDTTDNKYNVSAFNSSGCWIETVDKECSWCDLTRDSSNALELMNEDPEKYFSLARKHVRINSLYEEEMKKIKVSKEFIFHEDKHTVYPPKKSSTSTVNVSF